MGDASISHWFNFDYSYSVVLIFGMPFYYSLIVATDSDPLIEVKLMVLTVNYG
jgi:hypothetical protein